jgi:hypothetical protein
MKVLVQIMISLMAVVAVSTVHADPSGLGPAAGPNPVPGSTIGPNPVPGSTTQPTPYPNPTPAPVPAPCPAPGELAEIQIFYGYVGYDNYAWKAVSTQVSPISIGTILGGYQTAACYKGDPTAALALFGTMVDLYNSQNRRAIQFVAGNFYYYADGKGALQLATRDEMGNPFLDFPRMIECDRWSTPAERGY